MITYVKRLMFAQLNFCWHLLNPLNHDACCTLEGNFRPSVGLLSCNVGCSLKFGHFSCRKKYWGTGGIRQGCVSSYQWWLYELEK